ncbi:MAG TPA: hypothetical protein VG253_05085 [Streptosporangiaceae bacterium]|nr:hypothetical protein [Streptosporangiaceae bacterium]
MLSQTPPITGPEGSGWILPLLTRRRVVDYCRVATELCPGSSRRGVRSCE